MSADFFSSTGASHRREVKREMAKNCTKVLGACASILVVLFAVACGAQPTQTEQAPATETTQAPAEQQAAPAEGTAAEGAAPAEGATQEAAPAEGQPAEPQQ
jgi:hypothetical protein